jgi:hypothetical protein
MGGGSGFAFVSGWRASRASAGWRARWRCTDPKVGDEAARPPLQRQELIKRVRDWVRMSPMFWEQDPYRAELFRLCQANKDVGGNQLADALRGQLPETTLHRLVLVWNAWRYALERV